MAILLLLLIATLAPAFAAPTGQPPRVEEPAVTGYVLTPEGTPVSEGTVVAQAGTTRTTASIDRTGRFRLITTRSGPHQIVVSVPGLSLYRVAVTVPASRSVRLPVIRLAPAGYFRVRLISPSGEPIGAPLFRRRVFDASGSPISDAVSDRIVDRTDADGAIVMGPLPRGIMTMAVDNPAFAQTRLPDLNFDGATKIVDGGTIVLQQPGAVLNVDLIDGLGAPVPEQDVYLEDALPRSPLVFPRRRTNLQGRATFDRLAAGRYRLWTTTRERCAGQTFLVAARSVALSGSGIVETRLILGGHATFHVTLPFGPA